MEKQLRKQATMAQNEYGERVIKIALTYDLDILFQVRNLPGRKYHPESKVWSAPVHVETIHALQKWGFTIDDNLKAYVEHVELKGNKIVRDGIPELKGTLFPFQSKGVSFVETHDGRALIADEMGLGKTIQALAWLQLHPEIGPAIVVCPASLKLNWEREIQNWLPNPSVQILSGTTPWKISNKRIIIINYDILESWVEELKKVNPQVLITDECHYYKSNKAQRTRAVKKLAKGIPHVLALSGTPILNRPIEIYNALKLIDENLFPSYRYFVNQYCNYHFNGFGYDVSGATNIEELNEKLTSSVMIRRLKKDVLQDLPEKIYSFVPIELDNRSEYDEAEKDFIKFIRREKGEIAAQRASNAESLVRVGELKRIAVKGKFSPVQAWIENFLEVDGKLVVFAEHKFVIDELMHQFGDYAVKIDGSCTGIQRQKAVDMFQTEDAVRLFIGNIQAAGVGITLTAASNVAFIELPWTPGALVQAADRCHRIGQRECVNIHYLLAKDTIEEKIAHLLDTKKKVVDAVLDGTITEESSLLTEIIKQYES
jgi:SWI/SNF-related matrix-associated actin-dependent regulator of chromatin subfamily A-like protein 1